MVDMIHWLSNCLFFRVQRICFFCMCHCFSGARKPAVLLGFLDFINYTQYALKSVHGSKSSVATV